MIRALPVFAVVLALAACKKPDAGLAPARDTSMAAASSDTTAEASSSPAAADGAAAPSAPVTKPKPVHPGPEAPASPNVTPMLAYSYGYGIEAPPSRVRALVGKHQAACIAAGPAACEITGATISETTKDNVSAHLTLRATPAWLKGYEDHLTRDADEAGGRLSKSEIKTEDLSRQIIDTEASVRAKTALRDRLQTMLATHPGALSDLLAVQEKLAEVQGDLDATSSELAAMRERVATSDVTIDYDSAGVLAPQGSGAPIAHALGSVTGILAGTLAAMIYLIAFTAPWLAIIALVLWLLRKRLPKWGKKAPGMSQNPGSTSEP